MVITKVADRQTHYELWFTASEIGQLERASGEKGILPGPFLKHIIRNALIVFGVKKEDH